MMFAMTRAAAVAAAIMVLSNCGGMPWQALDQARRQPLGIWTGDAVAHTRYGKVQGYEDEDQTWVWRAIPYAAPPVGELRWRAPRDPAPWNGVRPGLHFNAGCTQFLLPHFRAITGSEDCLYLNVWRPRGIESHLPVYVWIHGGGNSSGSSTELPAYYGNRLAARSNMVFVSLNYRLGPFGWFAEPALREDSSPEDASGDYGTLDIIKALHWIQENIAAFGGDPTRVTIAGQSAGATDILSLLLSPLAIGLFQGAIYESGIPTSATLSRGRTRATQAFNTLRLHDRRARGYEESDRPSPTPSAADIRSYLRSKSDREIMDCYTIDSAGILDNPAPLLDGYVLPPEGFARFKTGDYPNKVPLLMGSNKEEVKLFLMYAAVPLPSQEYSATARWGSRLWQAAGVDAVARELAAAPGQPPVYVYRFDWGAPDDDGKSVEPGNWGERLGAFHGLEIPFFLGQDKLEDLVDPLIFSPENEPGRTALSAAMMSYAAQFARTGNPNAPGTDLPEWRAWSNDIGAPKYIIFDSRGDTPSLLMSDADLSNADVMGSPENEVNEALLGRVQDLLDTARVAMQ